MKSFSVIPKIKILYWIISLSLLMGIGSVIFLVINAVNVFDGVTDVALPKHLSFSLVVFSLIGFLPFIIVLLALIWICYCVYLIYKLRLIFGEQNLQLETPKRLAFLHPNGFKPFTIPYVQIKLVKSAQLIPGALEILSDTGQSFKLLPAMFGEKHGENILLELQAHLPPECFEAGIDVRGSANRWSKGQRTTIIIAILILMAYVTTLLIDPSLSGHSYLTNTWQVRSHHWGFEDTWTYSLDDQNTFWVAAWRSDYYRIYHFTNQVEQEWKLPNAVLGNHYPQLVSGDATGRPIVWVEDRVFHFDNGTWRETFYKDDLVVSTYSAVVFGEQAWLIEASDTKPNDLLKINALTGNATILPLPETAKQQNLVPDSIHRAVNGTLLVFMKNESNGRVYLLSGDHWMSQEYSIILVEKSYLRDCYLDQEGFLWILMQIGNEFFVEKIHPNGEFYLTHLPSPGVADEWERYETLIVDSSERLWVQGSYPDFMAVFTPVWKQQATELIRYTNANSNFQRNLGHPIVDPQGRIWSFGQVITSMDTNLTVLPDPLPTWFANLSWGTIRLVLILAQLPLLFLNHFLISRRNSPKKEKKH